MRGSGSFPFAASLLLLVPAVAFAGNPTGFDLGAPGPDEDPLIYGGTPTPSCGWPTTVFLGGCTGTLVHPQVVIYAAHCGSGVGSIRFGENGEAPAKTMGTKYCQTNPAYQGGQPGTDHAFCVLSEPVEAPIVPILMGCETQVLQPGQEVTIVGFGNADNGPFGIKRNVTTTINSVGAEAFIGGNGKDSCQGDSGGPVYVKLSAAQGGDETWRVFGITSYGGACGTGGYYSMMHNGMTWIEGQLAAENIDLTPCHTSDGTWQPTVDCFGFPLDPATGHGTWTDWCDPGPQGAWSAICGAPFNDEPDDTAPAVTITAPTQGQEFMSDGTSAVVTIDVTADDGDGWGVQSVQLLIDGNPVQNGQLFQPPFQWQPGFPTGQFEIGALAVDYAGNEGYADPIYIGVDMPAMEPPEPEDTSGTDGEGGTGGDGDGDGPGGSGDGDGGGKGCGCTTSGDGPAGLALLGLGLMFARRRRAV
jgi:MYXO-CTERM domain-containing protein